MFKSVSFLHQHDCSGALEDNIIWQNGRVEGDCVCFSERKVSRMLSSLCLCVSAKPESQNMSSDSP